jgi:hypothetical protein
MEVCSDLPHRAGEDLGIEPHPIDAGEPMRIARLLSPTNVAGIVGGPVAALVALTAVPASAETLAVADTPLGCDGYNTPAGWTHDQAFHNPSVNKFIPCTRCNEAKRRLEASGSFRGYCRDTSPGARADLYRFCVACRATATEETDR